MERLINEIKHILDEFGGEIELKSSLICKMSPHSPPVKMKKISSSDIENYSEPVLQTILQRLKLIKNFGNS